MTPPPLTPHNPEQQPFPARKLNWPLFLAAIFVPTIATAAAAAANLKDAAPVFAIAGAGLSAAVAAVMLARRFGKSDATRFTLGLLFLAVFAVGCITMNCFGCLAAGYKFNIH